MVMAMELYSPSTASLRSCIILRLRALVIVQRFNHTVPQVGGQTKLYSDVGHDQSFVPGSIASLSGGTVLDSRKIGIDRKKIPQSPSNVLKVLKQKGFDAYLVGGCVRDLLLHKVPKDYDIITTAKLFEIRDSFRRCQIVGRRFPICIVQMKDSVVEVSSFETVRKQTKGKRDFISPRMPRGCDKGDLLRWTNSMRRDFTINSLFFNPLDDKLYDYTNALSDLWSSKLRTVIPAQKSFQEDCARILRGLRLAARLNFSFSKETQNAIHRLGSSIQSLSKSRILMELDYMLSYGAAEPSLKLLHRFRLVDILLPIQAAHLKQQASKTPGNNSLMLLKLFANLDELVGCDRPAHGCLWVSLLAFHQALIIKQQPSVVVMAFASVLYHGNWEEGVQFARRHAKAMQMYKPEISDCLDSISDDKLAKFFSQFEHQLLGSVNALTHSVDLQATMKKFPGSACPGLVFISKKLGKDAKQIFKIQQGSTSLNMKRKNQEIDYDSLRKGDIREARFVLGKIIVNTLISDSVQEEVVKLEKDASHILGFSQRAEKNTRIHPVVANSREHEPPIQKDRSSKKQLIVSEDGQIVSEKQKLVVEDIDLSERGRKSKEKDFGNIQSGDVLIHLVVGNSREHRPPMKKVRSSKKLLIVSEEGQKVSEKQKLVVDNTNPPEGGRNSNKQSGDVLKIHSAVENLREHQPPMKKDKPSKKQPIVTEEGHKVSKKQKLVVKDTDLSEGGRNSKEKNAGKKQSGDVARKQKKMVDDNNCIEMDGRHFRVSSEGTSCVLDKHAKKTQEKQPGDKRTEAKDFLKMLDDLSDDDRMSKHEWHHFPGDSCFEQLEVVASSVDERDESKKSVKKKKAKEIKQKSSHVKLSSLF